MALDESFVGRSYPPTESYEVGREKIREFAEAIGDYNPVYRDRAAAQLLGHPDVIAPPTMAIIVSMRAQAKVITDPALGLDYSRVVHGEQSFSYERPIHAGDVLSAAVSVESIRQAGSNDMIRLRGEITDQAGGLVVTTHSTIVVRGTA